MGKVVKVLHLITGLGTGGAETMLAKLIANMDGRRFRTLVVSMTGHGVLGPRIEAVGVSVLSLGMARGVPDPRALFRFVALLRRESPDVLQTWLYHADLLGLIAWRLAGAQSIVWNLRCSDMDMTRYSRLSRYIPWLLARLSSYPAAVIANSSAARSAHERLGYRPHRWEIIPNGFELDRFRPEPSARERLRRELRVPGDAVLIGLPARFDPMKDTATFVAAAADLAQANGTVHFLLIGRGHDPTNRNLVDLIAPSGIGDRVHLLGERHDMPRVLAGLDIVTLSSAFGEGFPNVLGEAMACGVPCVSTDVGDAAGIIGDTGVVVPRRDPAALSVAWRSLLDVGPDGRARLGTAARLRIAENYALPAIVARYEALYAELARPV